MFVEVLFCLRSLLRLSRRNNKACQNQNSIQVAVVIPDVATMITTPKFQSVHLASGWALGIAVLFFGIGLFGVTGPLLPEISESMVEPELGQVEIFEEFDTEAMGDDGVSAEESLDNDSNDEVGEDSEAEDDSLKDFEIPPLPEIVKPITAPEMAEILTQESVPQRSKKEEVVTRKPAPKAPTPRRATPGTGSQSTGSGNTKKGGTADKGTGSSSGNGDRGGRKSGPSKGRFPQPSYPSSARRAKLEGVVKLAVTVQSNGVPSSVTISHSSGHSVLDQAARDHVSRRWRWPSGKSGRFIVPIRFVLR